MEKIMTETNYKHTKTRKDLGSMTQLAIVAALCMGIGFHSAETLGDSDARELKLAASIADAAASFGKVLPALMSRDDYGSLNTVSQVYFVLATAYKRVDEAPAACAALSQSLDYYRRALAKEPHTPSYERAVSPNDAEDDGQRAVRAQFDCPALSLTEARFDDSGIPVTRPFGPASAGGVAASFEKVLPSLGRWTTTGPSAR
jgi:hypothetical protein